MHLYFQAIHSAEPPLVGNFTVTMKQDPLNLYRSSKATRHVNLWCGLDMLQTIALLVANALYRPLGDDVAGSRQNTARRLCF